MTVADALMLWAIERVYPSDFTSRKQSIRKLEKSRFWGFHMKIVISKSGLAVSLPKNANISGTIQAMKIPKLSLCIEDWSFLVT